MKAKEKEKLVIIDGNAIIHRSYHALPPFTTKKGELVNAVYGFTSTLLTVIDKFKPKYIVATFDLKAPTFRHKKFKDYKATRVKGPDELYAQISRVKEIVQAFGIPIYEKENFEADDVIGTIAQQVNENSKNKKSNLEMIIVTGDLDTLQLIKPNVKVYTMSRGINKAVLYDEQAVRERYTLTPEQLKDFKGLRGDTSDNIPGVKGIGEKGAINLLTKYKTLEGVYQNINEIKGALKEKLETDKAQAFLSKDLGIIKTDVPIKFNLSKCKTIDFDQNKLLTLFRELGFHSLIKRFLKNNGEEIDKKVIKEVKSFKYKIIKYSEVDKI
ncbi:MAG TPA: DNA polymerase I, partial [Candidatus Moranbacteria bacterium]|nr:DNA polymerase I [Candidatus Moranbacteria bacterium]